MILHLVSHSIIWLFFFFTVSCHAAFLSCFMTAVPFIVYRTDSRTLKMRINHKENDYILTAIRNTHALIWFTHYNSPFTVTAIIKIHLCRFKILQKTHLISNNKYLSKMYILLEMIALLFDCTLSVLHACCSRVNAWLSNIYRWIIYLCHVMHWGKHNVSNTLNSTDIVIVCQGGSIWSMIDIKGCLRICVHKLVRLCEFN